MSSRKVYRNHFLSILIAVVFLVIACDRQSTEPVLQYTYRQPESREDGWPTASLSDADMDETSIVRFMNEIINMDDHKIHGILVVKDGSLVFEEYFGGIRFYHGPWVEFNGETPHNLASVTKSITSALVGLAIDGGFIQDVDQKIFDSFPDYATLRNEDNDSLTIEHLITMTSGLEWDEKSVPYTDSRNDLWGMYRHTDPVRFILEKPVVVEPGTEFNYNGGNVIVLGEIIRRATGMRVETFAEQVLFGPLGIREVEWETLPDGTCYTSGDMRMRPRDMAKFGLLYLDGGSWKGERVISSEWVDASTRPFIPQNPYWETGYLWWLHTYEIAGETIPAFVASGWGGQRIVVVPSLQMVIVFTAGYYDEPDEEAHVTVGTMLILAAAL